MAGVGKKVEIAMIRDAQYIFALGVYEKNKYLFLILLLRAFTCLECFPIGEKSPGSCNPL